MSKINNDRWQLVKASRIVVKLGTGVLSTEDGHLDFHRIRHLAGQVAELRSRKKELILVSSGAIGAGMGRLGLKKRPTRIHDLQACAAIGQNLLMARYDDAFAREGLTVAQILLTHEDLRHAQRRQNVRNTLFHLLKLGVVPVINENDAVSFAEIQFGDNDQLASMVHEVASASACLILSNVEGFLIKGKVLPTIPKMTAEIERHAGGAGSQRSVGGMRSKILAARRVNATGSPMAIASGHIPKVLLRLLEGEVLGTVFLSDSKKRTRKGLKYE